MKKKGILHFLFVLLLLFSACSVTVDDASPTGNVVSSSSQEDMVRIPVSELSQEMKKYSLDVDGVQVNYFAVIGSDGEVRTAFDACDVCGGHRGYRQEGDDVVCNQCGRFFSIDDLGTTNRGGGCWPSFLSHRIDGDELVINKEEIAAGVFRFK